MSNKTILITGGSGKIGAQLVAHFLKHDWSVITTARDVAHMDKTISDFDLKHYEFNLQIVAVDFRDREAAQDLCQTLERNNMRPHVLIHNARSRETLVVREDGVSDSCMLEEEYRVGVVVPYEMTMSLISHPASVLENVVFISSIYGVVAPTPALYERFEQSSPIQYGLVKAAQIHLTKELAVRLAPRGIRTNCVSFGGIKGRVDDEFVKRYEALTPMGGMLAEKDVIGPVDFLVSEHSRNMTGHNLIIDGGWTVW